ncbi:MAG: alanine racemase [Clostridiales bacterium]|nr:alanine racemase [Clostridiales bacterium]
MYKEAKRPAWTEISLPNLDYNIKSVQKKIGPAIEIIGIIKADGYGHGAFEAASVLRENGVKAFGVATISEAASLRDKGVLEDIVLLGLTPDMYAGAIVEYDVIPVVCTYQNALSISEEAEKSGKTICGFVAVDTGMGRIGFSAECPASVSEVEMMSRLPNFKIKGLFSHFATADAADKSYANEQESRFAAFYSKLKCAGIDVRYRTFANSAAIMEIPSSHFDAVRPGIVLYGCYPSAEVDRNELPIKPVMSVKANIVQLKKVPPGTSISYGRKFISSRESLIATLTLGYADGYPRPCSGQAEVIVNGVFAPVAGNICMDYCMVDVTDVPGVKTGDEAIVMGSDGKNTILADDIARMTGTINYEIVCAFGQRLPKVYVR